MDDRLKRVQKLLDAAEADLHTARSLMREIMELGDNVAIDLKGKAKDLSVLEEGKIVEGVFNGQVMVGADDKEYQVPANYASKSKLVEGDTLKLTIGDDGSFMFKQIAPTERKKIIGILSQSDGTYTVNAEGKNYKVLQASITYYKGEPGDQATIIIPKEHDSTWAAVENIIKKDDTEPAQNSDSFFAPGKAEKKPDGQTTQNEKTDTKGKEELSSSDQNLLEKLKPEEVEPVSSNTIHDMHTISDEQTTDSSNEGQVIPESAEAQTQDNQEIKELEI
ncbi:MAG: hypothetical protein PHU86_02450 [Patescibacteria group bacterium]|nr:hypothetical protein [Patescibacteria group bacterium]